MNNPFVVELDFIIDSLGNGEICNNIISSPSKDNFVSSLSILMLLIDLSYLTELADNSNTMVGSGGDSWHPCLVPHPRWMKLIASSIFWFKKK